MLLDEFSIEMMVGMPGGSKRTLSSASSGSDEVNRFRSRSSRRAMTGAAAKEHDDEHALYQYVRSSYFPPIKVSLAHCEIHMGVFTMAFDVCDPYLRPQSRHTDRDSVAVDIRRSASLFFRGSQYTANVCQFSGDDTHLVRGRVKTYTHILA